jgi:hypothetical protein
MSEKMYEVEPYVVPADGGHEGEKGVAPVNPNAAPSDPTHQFEVRKDSTPHSPSSKS